MPNGTGLKFNWAYLIVGVILIAVFATETPKYGKMVLGLVVTAALLLAGDKIMDTVQARP